jgi:hypothetical protein
MKLANGATLLDEANKQYKTFLQNDYLDSLVETASGFLHQLLIEDVPADGEWRSKDMFAATWEVIFKATTKTVFGTGWYKGEYSKALRDFDQAFPILTLGVPLWAVGVAKARDLLSRSFHKFDPSSDTSQLIKERHSLLLHDEVDVRDHDNGLVRVVLGIPWM